MDYITAGNELIEAREKLERVRAAATRARAVMRLQQALEEKSERRKRLVRHQVVHQERAQAASA